MKNALLFIFSSFVATTSLSMDSGLESSPENRDRSHIFDLSNAEDLLTLENICINYLEKWRTAYQNMQPDVIANMTKATLSPRHVFNHNKDKTDQSIQIQLIEHFGELYPNADNEISQFDLLILDEIENEQPKTPQLSGAINHIKDTLRNMWRITQITDIFDNIAFRFFTTGNHEKALKWALIARDWYVKNYQEYLGVGINIGSAESYDLIRRIYSNNKEQFPLSNLEESLNILIEEQNMKFFYYPEKSRVAIFFKEEATKIANLRGAYSLADKALLAYFASSEHLCDGNVYELIRSYDNAGRLCDFVAIVQQTKHAQKAVEYYEKYIQNHN